MVSFIFEVKFQKGAVRFNFCLSLLLAPGAGKRVHAAEVASPVQVDLHSHLWMKDGVSFLLRGEFHEPVKSGSASSRAGTKMTRDSLDASGLKLIVVSLYAHPVLARLPERLGIFSTLHATWFVKACFGKSRRQKPS